MKRTRVLLLGMPTMLRQIVREAVATVPDIDIVGEVPGSLDDLDEVIAATPDVFVVGREDTSDAAVARLLRERSGVRVLGISSDGAQTTLYEMRPHRVSLGELGPAALAALIRGPAGEA
jgi:chemotaxis response regulator CheB